jgi:hypothetical protein
MGKIRKVYRESLPVLRLIGKRYVDDDRGKDGGFSGQWDEWCRRGWFKPLEALGSLTENEDAYVSCMRYAGEFEYWIGMFFPRDTSVPDGYSYVDIPAGDIGTRWIHGRDGRSFSRYNTQYVPSCGIIWQQEVPAANCRDSAGRKNQGLGC